MNTGIIEVLEEIQNVLMEGEELTEVSDYYPFKRKAKLGPGPRGSIHRKKGRWDCKCDNYECQCKGVGDNKGKEKTIVIDREYKTAYNSQYKKWRKGHKKKAGQTAKLRASLLTRRKKK